MQVDPMAPELGADDFAAMMNASKVCVLVHDAATKNILWANPAACEMLEFSLSELRPLKANHMSSSAQQYDRVIGRAWLQAAVDHGSSRIVWHYRSKSGRVIPTDAVAIRVELARGPAVMVQFRDIQRAEEVERELKLTTSYVDALARHTSTVAFMLDAAGAVRFATDSALTFLGLTGDDDRLAGEPLTAYARLYLDGRPVRWAEVAAGADPVGPVQLEVSGECATWLEGSLERLSESEVDAYLMILHDVSERVRGEARRELELRHENYLARYNAMGDLAMAIAHELGQPLAAAANFIAGIRARAATMATAGDVRDQIAGQMGYGLDSVARQIDRAKEIVGSLRSFVGHLEQVEQLVDLNEIVRECLYFIELSAAPNAVEVEVRLDPAPVPVRCERVLTGQVVMNLCLNAIDETAECEPLLRRITVSTQVKEGVGVLTVDDHGRGVSRDPFAESFTGKPGGSGIGLALSHRIITRQHGSIWAELREEGGSRFGFALPLAEQGAT
ncbi:PAS domain-containing sensor histidine kinase [Amycolatopsis azurea]|uniref:histidine kinase n=2 Tax=Amycolatopsis azurea DSM 43854 TaxID=1238180 RepID=M2QCQ2_9PSEU|nr:PAS domain-containing sensor histidine kinase [Amycolatopsis azurea]EMD24511.1 Sensor protein FixL [Amycolatopsis azurea DSM 43854]